MRSSFLVEADECLFMVVLASTSELPLPSVLESSGEEGCLDTTGRVSSFTSSLSERCPKPIFRRRVNRTMVV
jgi:hypothetical protein